MATEVKCPFDSNISLVSMDDGDSSFIIRTPFGIRRMDDYSYAVKEHLVPVDEVGLDGNVSDHKVLSAAGYDYLFPHKGATDNISTEQENSIGWFSSWGTSSGNIGYSLGNDWKFDYHVDSTTTSKKGISDKIDDLSGACGLNKEKDIWSFLPHWFDTNGWFILRNNNAIFEYLMTRPGPEYLRVSLGRDDTETQGYWFKTDILEAGKYLYTLYGDSYRKTEKEKRAKEHSTEYVPLKNTDETFYTVTQFEASLGLDFNDPSTFHDGKKEYVWEIYGLYTYNGTEQFFECDKKIQDKVSGYLYSCKLKESFSSFRDMLERSIDYCGILVSNVKYASLVLVDKKSEVRKAYIVGDTIAVSFDSVSTDCSYLPEMIKDGDTLTFSTPNAMSKPEFLANGLGLLDFPCYKVHGDTLCSVEQANFYYDASRNKTKFDIKVKGLFPVSIDIDCDKTDWELIDRKISYIVPPIFDVSKEYATSYEDYARDVTTSARNGYPMTTGREQLTLAPVAYYESPTSPFGNYEGKLTLGSKYPMTPVAAIKFAFEAVFTVEVEGNAISHTFTVSAPELTQTETIYVTYSMLGLNISAEKLSNKEKVSIGAVELMPYMYDATKVTIKNPGKVKSLELLNGDVTVTLSDNTGNGKGVSDVNLSDVVLGKYDDFIFSNGLAYDPIRDTHEVIIYIASYCDTGEFAGKGFNDSNVNVRVEVPESYRKKFNVADYDYSITYLTMLPPYMIQGNIYTKKPEDELVLNSTISPSNSSARVDYLYGSYSENSYGISTDGMFTNAKPLYYCKASAFFPDEFAGAISDLSCYMQDDATGKKTDLAVTSADEGISEYTVLTSGNSTGYEISSDVNSATTNLRVYSFEQSIDVEEAKQQHSVSTNRIVVSAHIDYTVATSMTETMERKVRIIGD